MQELPEHPLLSNCREPNGAQVERLAGLAMKRTPSVDFSGYWQRHAMKEAVN